MAAATPAPSVPPAPATPAPATGTRSRADVAAPPTAPPERAIPLRAAATAAAPAPAGEIRALVAKLTLQVLSWSPDPRDRFVFVNGRKYVEGQSIDDKLLVERITDGGVVLSYQGERATLRSP